MSGVEVEQWASVHSAYHFDGGSERAAFGSGSSAPRTISAMSRTPVAAGPVPVINVDDDSDTPEESEPPTDRLTFDNGSRDHPVYIIDDNDDAPPRDVPTTNGGQASPIIVLDSDDEQIASATAPPQPRPRHSTLRRRGGRNSSSFRIFSPPPPPQHYEVPPVPPVPPIIARPMPFSLLPPPQPSARSRTSFDESPQPQSTSTSTSTSRVPNIQLGGGLFSQGSSSSRRRGPRAQLHFHPVPDDLLQPTTLETTNANVNANADANMPTPSPNFRGVPASAMETFSRFGRFVASYISPNNVTMTSNTTPAHIHTHSHSHTHNPRARARTRASDFEALPLRDWYDGISWTDFFFHENERERNRYYDYTVPGLGPWTRRDAAIGLGPDYDRAMTHPGQAGIGWTFDFGVEEGEEGGTKVTAETAEILVCAKCLDPLLANAEGMVDVSESEKKDRKVWGLRCGHVLDGKCIVGLMKPSEEEEEEERQKEGANVGKDVTATTKGKGKGKGKGKQVDKEVIQIVDVKGKGKATASVPAISQADEPPSENSMRSRLRTRRTTVVPWSATPSTRQRRQGNAQPVLPAPNPTPRRRGTKRKREEEIVEARRVWTCPVSGCGRQHGSIKVGGIWKMNPETGAVGIYV